MWGRVRIPGAWLAEWSRKHPSGAIAAFAVLVKALVADAVAIATVVAENKKATKQEWDEHPATRWRCPRVVLPGAGCRPSPPSHERQVSVART
jgi:hypothetical protein